MSWSAKIYLIVCFALFYTVLFRSPFMLQTKKTAAVFYKTSAKANRSGLARREISWWAPASRSFSVPRPYTRIYFSGLTQSADRLSIQRTGHDVCRVSPSERTTLPGSRSVYHFRLGSEFFSARSAGSSRKLRLNRNHAPKVNARTYWAYNRLIMPMYEHLCCHLRRGLIVCCVCA